MTVTETRTNPIGRFLPILGWLPRYERTWLRPDIIAGLMLWGLVVPEAIAYAGIAGPPPQAGLYTLLASLLVYALLGTSRHLVVQATSATAALLASSVAVAVLATATDTAASTETYQAYAAAFVLVTGLVFLVAGLAKLGFITQFLCKPVMDGFVMGIAIFVAVGQLNKLFGVPKPEGNVIEKLLGIVAALPEANWATFIVGVVAMVLRRLLKELRDQKVAVYVTHLHEPVLEHGRKTGLIDVIGEDHIFPTVDLAVRSAEKVDAV